MAHVEAGVMKRWAFRVHRHPHSSMSGCHGTTSVEHPSETGWPHLPVDWLAGELVPEGATIIVSVEIIDRNENKVPTNYFHTNWPHRNTCGCTGEDVEVPT